MSEPAGYETSLTSLNSLEIEVSFFYMNPAPGPASVFLGVSVSWVGAGTGNGSWACFSVCQCDMRLFWWVWFPWCRSTVQSEYGVRRWDQMCLSDTAASHKHQWDVITSPHLSADQRRTSKNHKPETWFQHVLTCICCLTLWSDRCFHMPPIRRNIITYWIYKDQSFRSYPHSSSLYLHTVYDISSRMDILSCLWLSVNLLNRHVSLPVYELMQFQTGFVFSFHIQRFHCCSYTHIYDQYSHFHMKIFHMCKCMMWTKAWLKQMIHLVLSLNFSLLLI